MMLPIAIGAGRMRLNGGRAWFAMSGWLMRFWLKGTGLIGSGCANADLAKGLIWHSGCPARKPVSAPAVSPSGMPIVVIDSAAAPTIPMVAPMESAAHWPGFWVHPTPQVDGFDPWQAWWQTGPTPR